MARISVPTNSYNERRDGKPWICRVIDWPVGAARPEIEWGSWIGRPGNAGELVIDAAESDLIRWGQKDMRGRSHTYLQYGIVEADNTVRQVNDVDAARYWQIERAERIRLMAAAEGTI